MILGPLLVALIAQAQPPRDTRPASSTSTASIVGVVTSDDPQPKPLRRARVTLNGSGLEVGRTAITNDDGTFAFEGLPAGRYSIAGIKDAYVTMNYGSRRPGRAPTGVRLPDGGTGVTVARGETQRITLRLPRGAVITGVVADVDGQPAQGLLVTALVRRSAGAEGGLRYQSAGTSQSDDRGTYRIYGLPAGTYVVSAQPQAPPRPGGPVVAGTRVVSQGTDRLSILSTVFSPAATDVRNASRVLVTTGEERSGIDVRLQYVPLAKVSGFVTPTGQSSGATVMLGHSADSFGRDQEVQGAAPADSDGRFEFGNVPPGQYTIFALARSSDHVGWQVARTDIAIAGEDLTGVSVSLEPAFTIAGRLVIDGSAVKPDLALDLTLQLSTPRELPGMAGVMLDVRGDRFTAGPFGPGLYRRSNYRSQAGVTSPIGKWWLKSVVANGRDILDTPLDLHQSIDDAVATLSDRASELSGLVTDPKGTPAPEPFVVVFSTDRATWFPGSRRVVGMHPDKDGRYSIRNLPPGDYRVVATSDLEEWEWFDPDVLDRLSATAARVTIAGVEKQSLDLTVR